MKALAIRLCCIGAIAAAGAHAFASGVTVASQDAKKTIWDGVYTDAQAGRGAGVYKDSCGSCHGDNLAGDSTTPGLIGADFLKNWTDMPLTELYTKVSAQMPADSPGSLKAPAYVDVVAYIIKMNDGRAGDVELPGTPKDLAQIMVTKKP